MPAAPNFLVLQQIYDARHKIMRILYSFPHPLGSPGIGTTAVQQVRGLLNRGHDVTVIVTSVHKNSPSLSASITKTMVVGELRIPHRVLGVDRTMAFHDLRVAAHLRKKPNSYDVVHCWPGAALSTCRAAQEIGVPAVREVPNTHTANAYEVVGELCDELGIALPPGHSHRLNVGRLKREEQEYQAASGLLVPSDHVQSTFLARGYPAEKLLRHRYGFDPQTFFPDKEPRSAPFKAVFLGTVEPRKGLHIGLQAWRAAGASESGAHFSIYGNVVEGYREVIERDLGMPNVTLNRFTDDSASVLRDADALLLPSFEEGSALVTYEAQGCGAVPLVSDAAGAQCINGVTGLTHSVGDVATLAGHIGSLMSDSSLLARMRGAVLKQRDDLTWDAAAKRLEECYARVVDGLGSGVGDPAKRKRSNA